MGVLPTVFSNNLFAAGVRLSACLLGVAGGPILPIFLPLSPLRVDDGVNDAVFE